MKIKVMALVLLPLLVGCAEVHRRDGRFTASAYSANILFIQIPKDPMETVSKQVPAGANVTNVSDTPSSWRTLPGFINRLFGVGWAQIGGTVNDVK
ncbi:MAG TPA: hypothetical protein PKI19_14570 [Elusimicrobiales bacterium]|nr:hypothetical protein [Elusimicrobiales bacterium]